MSNHIIGVLLIWFLFAFIYAMDENYASTKFTETFAVDLVAFILWPIKLLFCICKGVFKFFKGLK